MVHSGTIPCIQPVILKTYSLAKKCKTSVLPRWYKKTKKDMKNRKKLNDYEVNFQQQRDIFKS